MKSLYQRDILIKIKEEIMNGKAILLFLVLINIVKFYEKKVLSGMGMATKMRG